MKTMKTLNKAFILSTIIATIGCSTDDAVLMETQEVKKDIIEVATNARGVDQSVTTIVESITFLQNISLEEQIEIMNYYLNKYDGFKYHIAEISVNYILSVDINFGLRNELISDERFLLVEAVPGPTDDSEDNDYWTED